MVKNWWFKFDFKVWRTDSDLRRCTLETKGFWLELLCVMHEKDESSVTGSYEELGRLVGCDSAVAARCVVELERTKTADVTICNDEVTVKSRRYEKELNAKKHNKLRVQKHRGNANVTPPQHNRVISKEVISKEKEENTGEKSPPANDHFHPLSPALNPEKERLLGAASAAATRAVGFELPPLTAERIDAVVPERYAAEWFDFLSNRMIGFPGAHRNHIQTKLGYWLDDFVKRELPKLLPPKQANWKTEGGIQWI